MRRNGKEVMKSVGRLAVLTVLLWVSIAGLLSWSSYSNPNWLMLLVFSKAIAVGAGYAAVRLYRMWVKTDMLLKLYDRKCDEVLDAPNPMNSRKEVE